MLNIVVQGVFCIVVIRLWQDQSDEYTDERIHAFNIWRSTAPNTTISAVCDESQSLHNSYLHLNSIKEIREYTDQIVPGLNLHMGELVSFIVIVVWIMNVCQTLVEPFECSLAIFNLLNVNTRHTGISQNLQNFALTSFPLSRVLWCFFLLFFQEAISVVLLLGGSLWLAYTTRIADLVLNAMALGFITEVDEMVFKMLTPRVIKTVVMRLEPLALMTPQMFRKFRKPPPVRPCVSFLFIVIMIICIGLQGLSVHSAAVVGAGVALCPP